MPYFKYKLILTLAFFAWSNSGYSQTDTSNLSENFAKKNYSIQYPKSWRIDTSKIMGTELFIFSPLENETDRFSENVSVIIQDLSGQSIDLDKYKEVTESQIADMATEGKIFESSIIKEGNTGYYKIIYAMTQGKFRLKITSICYIIADKAYLATFTTEFDKYDQYKTVGDEILRSFSLPK